MKTRLFSVFCLGILFLAACVVPGGGAAPQGSAATATAPATAAPAEQPTQAPPSPAPSPAPTPSEASQEVVEPSLPFELISTVFEQGEPIPAKYSCNGEDISPSLAWGDPPEGTQSLALIIDDPDAPVGTWDHWILFNIPADVRELPEGMKAGTKLEGVTPIFGKNSWGRSDYGGPCPPSGTHRYFFKLYALDTTLSLDQNADKEQVLSAMDGHILAETELMGTFSH
jgi:Raf kinase inhibitor-like YbhB/YbcL family protein